jgi:putative heme-binding domain-containing protein
MGPDGAIYVADWHDERTAHPDPDADWDRSNGRVYRIAPKAHSQRSVKDFASLSTSELLELHDHHSQWFVRHARQELVRRADTSLIPRLMERAEESDNADQAIEALWTIASLGQFDETLAMKLLNSPHPAVRIWTVRLLGDTRNLSEEMAHRLDEFAEQDTSLEVRQQLACSAARWPAKYAVPMINANINRDIDNSDPCLPLLWWWAVERHSVNGREEVMKRFVRPSLWKSKLGSQFLLPRLIRRYAAEGTVDGLKCVERLLAAAPDDAARGTLWDDVLSGWRETPTGDIAEQRLEIVRAHALWNRVLAAWKNDTNNLTLQQLAIVLGHSEPLQAAYEDSLRDSVDVTRRLSLLHLISDGLKPEMTEPLLKVAESNDPEAVRLAAIRLLGRLDSSTISERFISLHQTKISDDMRSQIRSVLLSRRSSAMVWLNAVDRGEILPTTTPVDQIRSVSLFEDHQLNALVTKHWGRLQAATAEEKLAEVRRLNNDLRAGSGNAASGRLLFMKHCSACHQLFGEGTKLGPDLTSANRADRDFLLISLVDPGSVIRKEYVSIVLQTTDGRIETGLAVAQDASGTTIVTSKNERKFFAASEIEELRESGVSHMPDTLYRQLKPQELRDLFAWLQGDGQ